MISISLSFPSLAMLQPVQLEIALPHGVCAPPSPWKTIWGLHCAMENGKFFFHSLNTGLLVDKYGFAFIAPSLGNGWFVNSPQQAQADFLDEMLEALPDLLPLSTAREDNAVIGISMGGFGALRWALSSRKFASAAAISTVFDPEIKPDETLKKERVQYALYLALRRNMRQFLLDRAGRVNSEADLSRLLENDQAWRPFIYLYCGEQDYLALPQNLALEELLVRHDYPAQLSLSPGGHDLNYWQNIFEAAIRQILGAHNKAIQI